VLLHGVRAADQRRSRDSPGRRYISLRSPVSGSSSQPHVSPFQQSSDSPSGTSPPRLSPRAAESAYEAAQAIWRDEPLGFHEQRFALVEAISHLERLRRDRSGGGIPSGALAWRGLFKRFSSAHSREPAPPGHRLI